MGIPLHSIDVLEGSSRQGFDLARLKMFFQYGLLMPITAGAVTKLGAITAGSAFTSLPTLAPTGGTGSGMTAQATSLTAISATVVNGGTSGFATNDTITLSNGVVLTATASAGICTTATVASGGAFLGNYPALAANPVSQVATSGSGVGTTTWTLSYGLGSAEVTNSGLYTVVPTGVTVTGGGGTGASLAAPTLGGAGNPVSTFVPVNGLPPNYWVGLSPVVEANAGVCVATCPYKNMYGFTVQLTPILAANSFSIPVPVDILLIG